MRFSLIRCSCAVIPAGRSASPGRSRDPARDSQSVPSGPDLTLARFRADGHDRFSLKRWILPVWVLGRASTNLTERGYL